MLGGRVAGVAGEGRGVAGNRVFARVDVPVAIVQGRLEVGGIPSLAREYHQIGAAVTRWPQLALAGYVPAVQQSR